MFLSRPNTEEKTAFLALNGCHSNYSRTRLTPPASQRIGTSESKWLPDSRPHPARPPSGRKGWMILLLGLLVPINAGSEVVNVEEFTPWCAVFDVVDEFTDERTSKLLCLDEANQGAVGFQCVGTTRAAFLSLSFDLDWLASVGYRVDKDEVRWGTWRTSGKLAYQETDSEDDNIEARDDAARVIAELEDGVASGHSIAFEIDGTRSKIEFSTHSRRAEAMTAYRSRCATISVAEGD